MHIDHIGIVVKTIEEGIIHWQRIFGYRQMTEPIINTRQKVRVVFMGKENSLSVKLVEPIDERSAIYGLAKRGGGLHHLCFKCNNLAEELIKLQNFGLRLLCPPQPGEAFENENIAFVFAKQGLNIELIDTEKRAMLLG
ncbi:MAG: VOC family protein [Pseudomonadota bacterium]